MWRVHPRHQARRADRRVPAVRPEPADRAGLDIPGCRGADPDGRDRADRGEPELPARRNEHPDHGWGGPRHREADREPTAAASLRGLPQIVRIVLVGPPGAGKGTQAQFIASHLAIPRISTGDIFRFNVTNNTDLGRKAREFMEPGDLVPYELTVATVRARLAEADAHEDCR